MLVIEKENFELLNAAECVECRAGTRSKELVAIRTRNQKVVAVRDGRANSCALGDNLEHATLRSQHTDWITSITFSTRHERGSSGHADLKFTRRTQRSTCCVLRTRCEEDDITHTKHTRCH